MSRESFAKDERSRSMVSSIVFVISAVSIAFSLHATNERSKRGASAMRWAMGIATVVCGLGVAACRDQAAPSAPPRGAATPDAALGDAPSRSAVTAVGSAASPPFVPERIWAEGAAMGTHVGFAAFTTPQLGPQKIREAFDGAL